MDNNYSTLIASSKQVIKDCSLKNGAIVAANSTKPYYPEGAKYYKYVWPRDAMYTCKAAYILGLDIQEKFFRWCMTAEGWSETGLFYEKYYMNGKKAARNFQPDQTGSVLIALNDYCKSKGKSFKEFKSLIRKSADGLCKIWERDHFSIMTQDLWEERNCFPDLKENFTYSLAICARGLYCANELIPNKNWLLRAEEMKNILIDQFDDYYYRSFGKLNDNRVDASLLGLVWPAGIINADSNIMDNTVRLMEDKIINDYRVMRYEHDEYDGWMYQKKIHRKKGAGYWPLLNFWMSIYYINRNDKELAMRYFNRVCDDLKGNVYIPEQIFENKTQVSVSPLCWSHSMFVIAGKILGFI